jgi:hypothetical protein
LRKATVSFTKSARPHGTTPTVLIFMKFDIWGFFDTVTITDTLHGDQYKFFIISRSILRIRNVSDKGCRKNQSTFYVKYNFFNRTIYEIIWKNIVELDKSQSDARSLHAEYIPTNPHSEYVLIIGFHNSNGCTSAPECCDIFMFLSFYIRKPDTPKYSTVKQNSLVWCDLCFVLYD